MSDLKGKYHPCFFDNYFTSASLLVDLSKNGIYACGTARKDRVGFPEALKKPSLPNRCVGTHVCVKSASVCMDKLEKKLYMSDDINAREHV